MDDNLVIKVVFASIVVENKLSCFLEEKIINNTKGLTKKLYPILEKFAGVNVKDENNDNQKEMLNLDYKNDENQKKYLMLIKYLAQ